MKTGVCDLSASRLIATCVASVPVTACKAPGSRGGGLVGCVLSWPARTEMELRVRRAAPRGEPLAPFRDWLSNEFSFGRPCGSCGC